MSNTPILNLHFDGYSESCYLLKFGRKENLKEIQNGKIRFSHLDKYRNLENKNIGDNDEGLYSILHTDENAQILFSHPSLYNGKEIDVTKSVLSISDYPNTDFYISCLSYFTAQDIVEKNIFDNEILKEKEWDSVLFILDTSDFIDNIKKSLEKYAPVWDRVKYLDYNISHDALDVFSKSVTYKHQKELRIAFHLIDENCENVKRITNDTIEVSFEKVRSVIIPTCEFREGFSVKNL